MYVYVSVYTMCIYRCTPIYMCVYKCTPCVNIGVNARCGRACVYIGMWVYTQSQIHVYIEGVRMGVHAGVCIVEMYTCAGVYIVYM